LAEAARSSVERRLPCRPYGRGWVVLAGKPAVIKGGDVVFHA
jgi:hypothetical protein